MSDWTSSAVDASKVRRFDVISAGEAHLRMGSTGERARSGAARVGFAAGRGAVGTAVALARANQRVGLATTLDDDSFGRALAEQVATRGVDVSGVSFRRPDRGVVFVEALGNADELVPFRDEERPFTVPAAWSASVVVLSGVTPVVSIAGSLCRAARSARRAGAVVVVAVEARPHVWRGRDARAVRMVLREADVVRYTSHDLDVLRIDAREMRDLARADSVHVMSNTRGDVLATGPFGEIARSARGTDLDPFGGSEDSLTTSICVSLARAGEPAFDRKAMWDEAVAKGQALSAAP